MKKMLVTGGTVFVSKYIAEYYVANGYDVYVLNRNSREQSAGVKLIEADRHNSGDILRNYHFNVIIDTAYCSKDIDLLLHSLSSYDDYILISSSAVYRSGANNLLQRTANWVLISIGGNTEQTKLKRSRHCRKEIRMHTLLDHHICMDQ